MKNFGIQYKKVSTHKLLFKNSVIEKLLEIKKVKDGLPNDDGGHLIGKQFGGAGEQINYVPMKPGINQAPGTWYNMEKEWRDVLNINGGTVTEVEINIAYGANKRPTGFTVSARINGASVKTNYLHTN